MNNRGALGTLFSSVTQEMAKLVTTNDADNVRRRGTKDACRFSDKETLMPLYESTLHVIVIDWPSRQIPGWRSDTPSYHNGIGCCDQRAESSTSFYLRPGWHHRGPALEKMG